MARTLIRGGCVLTMGRTNFAEADVLIDGDTITEVGPGIRARDAEVVDASDTIVMPGFVDAHRHAWQSLLRNSGEVGAQVDAAEMSLAPDDVYAATLISLLAGTHAGITTVVDCTPFADAERVDAVLRAHADAAVRSVVVVGTAGGGLNRLAGSAGGLLSIAARPPDPLPGSVNDASKDWSSARSQGLRIHTHLAADSPRGLAAGLAESGMLGSDVTLVHCSNLDAADVAAIASSSASVVLTPAADMARGASSLPLQALIDAGVRPGLGVDTEHLTPGDIFAQLRAVISLQHATVFDRKLAGKASLPKLLNTRDVIRYSTVDGAAAAGLGDRTGVIEPGYQADLVVLRTDRPNIHPINDAIGAVVWGMDTSNVDWVFVAGRAVKSAGVMTADVTKARSLALDAHRRVMGAGVGAR